MIWILDANNIMHKFCNMQDRSIGDIQDAFLKRMQQVKGGRDDLFIVVFDGQSHSRTTIGKLKVIYSDAKEKADGVIKQLSEQYGRNEVTIVSSDRDVSHYAKLGGQTTMNSSRFIRTFLNNIETETESERLKQLGNTSQDYWLNLFKKENLP